jgi:CMP/dCMP kinase
VAGTGVGAAPVVAVDGPSGSGKSTVSRRLAQALEARYLDTGAMYRAVTWAVLEAGVDPQAADSVTKIALECVLRVGTDPADPHITLDGVSVDGPIRGPKVTAAVSAVSAVPAVRQHLVAQQRAIIAVARSGNGIVVEGRDIGAVVAPDAILKVYLTASATERARRRSAERDADLDATAADATGSTPPGPPIRWPRPPTRSSSTRPTSTSTRSWPSWSRCCGSGNKHDRGVGRQCGRLRG